MPDDPPDPLDDIATSALKDALERRGYVVVKEKSYKAAQRRQGIAESRRYWAEKEKESAERWAYDCLTEERRLRDRLNEIIHLATQHGMTTEDLVAFNDKLGLRATVLPQVPGLDAVTHEIAAHP